MQMQKSGHRHKNNLLTHCIMVLPKEEPTYPTGVRYNSTSPGTTFLASHTPWKTTLIDFFSQGLFFLNNSRHFGHKLTETKAFQYLKRLILH